MGGSESKNPLGLPDEDVEIFKATFDAFDVDGSGAIDKQELRELLLAFGVKVTDQELDVMIHEVDEDDSGEIEFDEFLRMVVLRMERNMMGDKEAVRTGFGVLDDDSSGSIDAEQLERILTAKLGGNVDSMGISTKEVQSMIRAVDTDDNGNVNFEELWEYASNRIKDQEGKRVEQLITRKK